MKEIKKLLFSLYQLLRYLIDISIIYILNFNKKNKTENKIIIIVKVDAIGDFIIWLKYAVELVNYYKDNEIILICNDKVREIAEEINLFNHILPVNIVLIDKSIKYRINLFKKISSLKAQIAIQPTYSRVAIEGDVLIAASNAREKISFYGDHVNDNKLNKYIANKIYTKLIKCNEIEAHENKRHIDFIKKITGKDKIHDLNIQTIFYSKNVLTIKKNKYCILFITASKNYREWPISNFIELAKKIKKNYQIDILICGQSKKIIDINSAIDVINLVNKTNLIELIQLINDAEFIVSNETSAIHIAQLLKVPYVCILGGGHFGRFMPYPVEELIKNSAVVHSNLSCFGCNWDCKFLNKNSKSYPCIEKISIEEVDFAVNLIQG
jgi:ADP-heptose:LPS heptosyltransferase